MRRFLYAALAMIAVGCGDSAQSLVRHAASAVGTASSKRTIGKWTVELTVARVALGPFTFCASRSASSDLCSSALAEVATVTTIDALSPSRQPIGDVVGFVGTVRSAGYGHGITWLATQSEPAASSRASGGHSVHLEGTATSDTDFFAFVADVDVAPLHRGTHAVTFSALDVSIDANTRGLEIVVDPSVWLADVDFDALAATTPRDPVVVAKGSRAHDAIAVSMSAIAPVQFRWFR